MLGWSIPATGALVETLFERAAEADVAEAEAAIDRLAQTPIESLAAPADCEFAVRDGWLLRMRALLARAASCCGVGGR